MIRILNKSRCYTVPDDAIEFNVWLPQKLTKHYTVEYKGIDLKIDISNTEGKYHVAKVCVAAGFYPVEVYITSANLIVNMLSIVSAYLEEVGRVHMEHIKRRSLKELIEALPSNAGATDWTADTLKQALDAVREVQDETR